MRLSADEARKQHDGIKKLYEQGLWGATASVEQVLDLFDTIEAQRQEIEKLKATLADWKYNAKCDADHIAALTAEKDELIELLKAARSRLPNAMRFCVCGKCKSCGEQIPYTNHIYCDHCLIILIDMAIGEKEDV